MHHTIRLYSRYRELFLRFYIFMARWTRLPLVGRLVRVVMDGESWACRKHIKSQLIITDQTPGSCVWCKLGEGFACGRYA